MFRGSVYLAGPIRQTGSLIEAIDWREKVAQVLNAEGIETFSPMRATAHLRRWKLAGDGSDPSHVMTRPSGILTRDRFDVKRADIVLANFLGATEASLGTAMEFGWADAWQIPVVMVVEDGNQHDHAMLNQVAGWRVPSLGEAVAVILGVL